MLLLFLVMNVYTNNPLNGMLALLRVFRLLEGVPTRAPLCCNHVAEKKEPTRKTRVC